MKLYQETVIFKSLKKVKICRSIRYEQPQQEIQKKEDMIQVNFLISKVHNAVQNVDVMEQVKKDLRLEGLRLTRESEMTSEVLIIQ